MTADLFTRIAAESIDANTEFGVSAEGEVITLFDEGSVYTFRVMHEVDFQDIHRQLVEANKKLAGIAIACVEASKKMIPIELDFEQESEPMGLADVLRPIGSQPVGSFQELEAAILRGGPPLIAEFTTRPFDSAQDIPDWAYGMPDHKGPKPVDLFTVLACRCSNVLIVGKGCTMPQCSACNECANLGQFAIIRDDVSWTEANDLVTKSKTFQNPPGFKEVTAGGLPGYKGLTLLEKLYNVAPCGWCSKPTVYEVGNHHPYCSCGHDQFRWNEAVTNLTKEAAETLAADESQW